MRKFFAFFVFMALNTAMLCSCKDENEMALGSRQSGFKYSQDGSILISTPESTYNINGSRYSKE